MRLLSEEQLARLKATLSQRLADARRQLEKNEHFGLRHAMAKESLGELSNVDNHPADQGSEWFERGKDLALKEHLQQEIADLERALKAMEEGRYGWCEVCRRAIPEERLEAMPTATTCIAHAPSSVSESRPMEERVIRELSARFDDPPGGNEEETAFYDTEDAWQDVARYNELVGVHEEEIEADESRGYAEEIEGFLATDLYGREQGYVDNRLRAEYQRRLDDAGVISILGNPRADDYTLWEGYVDVEQEQVRLKKEARSDIPPEGVPPEGV
jgi:YteA family regulatory protein